MFYLKILRVKILYLPAYFYPEQAASAYLSDNRNQAFADAGFDMVVYTPVPTRGISIEERKKYKHRKADSMYGGRMIVYRFSLMREGGGPIVRYATVCRGSDNFIGDVLPRRLGNAM